MVCRGLHGWLFLLHAFLMEWLAHAIHILVATIVLTLVNIGILVTIHVYIVIHLALDRC